MKYFTELQKAMTLVAEQPNIKIVGQTAIDKGTAMYNTLTHIPENKRLELPVCEAMQVNLSIGMSLNGFNILSIFPRWNFVLVGASQIINTLDKLHVMSDNEYVPHVIIRTSVGSEKPLWPNVQHLGDFSEGFKSMLDYIPVICLKNASQIVPEYLKALERKGSTILVEYADKYGE